MRRVIFSKAGVVFEDNHDLLSYEEVNIDVLNDFILLENNENYKKQFLPILKFKDRFEQCIEYEKKYKDAFKKDYYIENIMVHFVNKLNLASWFSFEFDVYNGVKSITLILKYSSSSGTIYKTGLIEPGILKKELPLDTGKLFYCQPIWDYPINNNICYIDTHKSFCLPISFLMKKHLESNPIKGYIKSFSSSICKTNNTILITFMTDRNLYWQQYEFVFYEGTIDLNTLAINIKEISTETYSSK